MKVLHVYRTYFPDPTGGLQEAIRQICLAIQPFGIASTIFTLSPDPTPALIERPEGRVVRCRSWAAPASCDLGGLSAFATFRRLASEADVVHFLFPWPFVDLLHAVTRARTPSVLTYISDVVRQRWLGAAYAPLMWRTLSRMQAIVANAAAYARTSPVLSHASLHAKLRVIPLGIVETSYPRDGDDTILHRLGLGADQPYFLFIGVLRYYKGLHSLVAAASRVRAPVVIVGTGPQGESLREQVRRDGVDNVIFAGHVSDREKVSLLRRCQAVLLPSHLRSEAFGMVLVEGAMFGRPMISCEIGTGTSLVNVDGETGLVVPPEDPASLAAAMNRLLADPALGAALGRGARLRYERLFSGEALGRAYSILFSEASRSGSGWN